MAAIPAKNEQEIQSAIIEILAKAGWNRETQIKEEFAFTQGQILVDQGKFSRGGIRRADIVLFYKKHLPIGLIEVKSGGMSIDAGMTQALEYSRVLDVPFSYSTNGEAFKEHNVFVKGEQQERLIPLQQFPTPEELWERYTKGNVLKSKVQERAILQEYYYDDTYKPPRYYQRIAINRSIEAIVKGHKRALVSLSQESGKNYVLLQIVAKLKNSKTKDRFLILFDRRAILDQTLEGFTPIYKNELSIIQQSNFEKNKSLYLATVQSLSQNQVFKEIPKDFFDLVLVDNPSRITSTSENPSRELLEYFSSADILGIGSTPTEFQDPPEYSFFGESIYNYSFQQSLADGFSAPFQLVRFSIDEVLENGNNFLNQTQQDQTNLVAK